MLDIRFVFNWVIKPLVIMVIMTMALSKMCETMSVLGTRVNKLSSSLEMMKKNSEDMSNIAGLVNVPVKTNTDISSQAYATSDIFNSSKPSRQGEWVFNK